MCEYKITLTKEQLDQLIYHLDYAKNCYQNDKENAYLKHTLNIIENELYEVRQLIKYLKEIPF